MASDYGFTILAKRAEDWILDNGYLFAMGDTSTARESLKALLYRAYDQGVKDVTRDVEKSLHGWAPYRAGPDL